MFFFQAEDGIRDIGVTGVQTCALPISDGYEVLARAEHLALYLELPAPLVGEMLEDFAREGFADFPEPPHDMEGAEDGAGEPEEGSVPSEGGAVSGGAAEEAREERSEERRVGKEGRYWRDWSSDVCSSDLSI